MKEKAPSYVVVCYRSVNDLDIDGFASSFFLQLVQERRRLRPNNKQQEFFYRFTPTSSVIITARCTLVQSAVLS